VRTTWAVAVMAKYAQSMPELQKFVFLFEENPSQI
jgi:hypothetical protein